MSPKPHDMEAAFEAHDDFKASQEMPMDTDDIVEDFTAFFERLSSIDDMNWADEGGATPSMEPEWEEAPLEPERKAHPEPSLAENKAATENTPRSGRNAPIPPMQVVRSDDFSASEFVGAQASPDVFLSQDAEGFGGETRRKGVGDYLKMMVAAVVLFSIGLGVGWAALSLPERFQSEKNGKGFWQQSSQTKALQKPSAESAIKQNQPARPLRENPLVKAAVEKEEAAAKAVAKTSGKSSGKSSGAAGANTKPDANVAATKLPELELPRAQASGVVNVPKASPAMAPTSAAKTPNAAGGSASFDLQVGACTSFACVENYRKLLLTQVNSGDILVVKEPRNDGTLMQRVRVGPMSKPEALSMKNALAQADQRLSGAYLVIHQ